MKQTQAILAVLMGVPVVVIRVGDQVQATYSEAAAVSMEPARKQ